MIHYSIAPRYVCAIEAVAGQSSQSTTTRQHMTSKLRTTSLAIAVAASIQVGAALAAPPTSVGNTTWSVQTNQSTEQLIITNQGGPGGPGGAACPLIIGTIGIAPIRGWYCPVTGRIHFLHNNLNSHVTVRVFTGNVSDGDPGQTWYMGGTMTVVNVGFGPFGEFNFSGVK
jgi:hypothetical protein